MKSGNRAMLEQAPRKNVAVEIEELDATFSLREMSGTERDIFEVSAFKPRVNGGEREVDPLYLRARLVALCLVGDDGIRLYADDEITQLSDNVPASIIAQLFVAAQKLNGLDAESVEAATKNLKPDRPDASHSDLH